MTDARIPERWLNDRRLLRLSDRGFRMFVVAMTWSVANRSNGTIDVEDLAMMPGNFTENDVTELQTAGVLSPGTCPWTLLDFVGTQTTSGELEVLENVRRREREKKARQRAAAVDKAGPEGSPPGQVPGGTSPGTALGQDRPGQAGHARQAVENPTTTETSSTDGYDVGACVDCGTSEQLGPDGLCSSCAVGAAVSARAV